MIPFQEYRCGLAVIRNSFLGLGGLAFIVQCYVDPSSDNILAGLLCLASLALASFLIINPRNERGGASLTGAAVFLSIAANSLIPLIITLLEGHSVIYTLKFPVQVFGHRLIFASVLLLAHFLACSALSGAAKNSLSGVFDVVGLRSKLYPKQLWVVGGLGFLILIALRIGGLNEGVVGKILHPMSFLATFPFLLLVPPYTNYLRQRRWMLLPLGGLFIASVALTVTSRMSMIMPIALVLSAYFVAILARQARLPRINPIKAIPLVIAGLFTLGQMMDFSDAILMERGKRSERSIGENISAIFDSFLDKQSLADYKEGKLSELDMLEGKYGALWKEDYIANPFAARFTSIKFDDNLLGAIQNYMAKDYSMIKAVTVEKIYTQIPDPVIQLFGLNVNKEFINSFSMGDIMDVLTNRNGSLGGFRTGSMVVHSFVCFGWWYPLVLTALLTLLFLIFQTFAISKGGGAISRGLSTFALSYCFTLYLSFAVEGYHFVIYQFVRGLWQFMLLYGLAIWFARTVAPQRVVKKRAMRHLIRKDAASNPN